MADCSLHFWSETHYPRGRIQVTNILSGQDSITSEKWSICPMCGPNSHIFFSWVSSMTRDLMICGLRSLPVFLLKNESPLLGHHKYTFLKQKGTKNTLQKSSLMLRPCCSFIFKPHFRMCMQMAKGHQLFQFCTKFVLILVKKIGQWRKIGIFQKISMCHIK